MFEEKYKQLLSNIGDHKAMVLSTADNDKVYSRMVSIVQFDEKFYFQTDCTMQKYDQLKMRSNISLCFDNVSIQGKCKEIGTPAGNEQFCKLYSKYFSSAYELYSFHKNEVLFEIVPQTIKLWVYENGEPYYEMYDVQNKSVTKQKYSLI